MVETGSMRQKMIIPAEKFLNFAKLAATVAPNDTRDYLRSIFVESRDGNAVMIATNSRFAAVQFLGVDAGPSFQANVTIDPYLLHQLQTELPYGSMIIVTPQSVGTSFGFVYPGNPFVSTDQVNEFLDWPKWFADGLAVKNSGCMFLDVDAAASLIATSPSGEIVWPEKIDTSKPVIVSDAKSSDWCGVFVPWSKGGTKHKFEKMPEWLEARIADHS